MSQPPSDWQATGGPVPDPSNPGFPPPGQQGFPPPGQQGFPPPGQGFPSQGQGYPPPGPGYPPPGQGFAPQGQQGFPPPGQPGGFPGQGYGAPSAQRPAFDVKTISINGWGILGGGLLTFIAGFFSWWSTVDISTSGLGFGLGSNRLSLSGFSQWWFIGPLLALAVAAIWGVQTFANQLKQIKPLYLAAAAALSFLLIVITLIQTFIKDTVEYCALGFCAAYGTDGGPSFGVFFALVTSGALLYFTAAWAQKSGASLPINVPTSASLDNRPFDGPSQGGYGQQQHPQQFQQGGSQQGGSQQGGSQQGGYQQGGYQQGPPQGQPGGYPQSQQGQGQPYQQGPPPGYQPPQGPPQQ